MAPRPAPAAASTAPPPRLPTPPSRPPVERLRPTARQQAPAERAEAASLSRPAATPRPLLLTAERRGGDSRSPREPLTADRTSMPRPPLSESFRADAKPPSQHSSPPLTADRHWGGPVANAGTHPHRPFSTHTPVFYGR